MDLRKLAYFFAVMEHRSLSAAAQALRVSQPTLTRQMQAFEAQFKTPLFIRSGRGMTPTEAGERLHEGLQGVQRQLLTLQEDIAVSLVEPAGEVAFGIPPSPRNLIAIRLISKFNRAFPRISLRVTEETSGQLRDLVANGLLDVAVTNFFEPMRGIQATPLASEPLMLIGPRQARLSPKRPVPIRKLGSLPLILTTRPNSLRLKIEAELEALGVRPDVRLEANTLPLMTDLVAAGLGYTVLPASGVGDLLRRKFISASPIAECFLTWVVATPKMRPLGLGAQKLYDMLLEIGRSMIGEGKWLPPIISSTKLRTKSRRKVRPQDERASSI